MTKFLPVILAAMLTAAPAFSQTPEPSAKPTPPADDDVVKISTNLIQIDVSVTDAKGKPITDLKPEEVEIYENGHKQSITNFSFVSSFRPAAETTPSGGKVAVPVPQQILRPEQIRRTIALVVDDLTLSFESAYQTKLALKKFVDEQMQEGDLVAIMRTGAGVGALQQFTSDKRLLYAAIEKVKWNASGTGGISAFAPIQAAPDTSLQTSPDDTSSADEPVESSGGQSLEDFRSAVFATGTLGALQYVVKGMSQLPGRKTVILFSDGFKLFETDEDGHPVSQQVLDYLRELVDVANRAAVIFYTVDPRGLANTALTALDNVSSTNPDTLQAATSSRLEELHDTQEGLQYLAEETGGFAAINNNNISGGVRRVLEDQSYYLVGYEPNPDTFDPVKRRFNALTVKVLRKGAKVRYRSGFFNVADRPASAAPEFNQHEQLEMALISPFAVTGINLRLNPLFGNNAKEGSFVRSLLHIDAGDLKFSVDKDGIRHAAFEVLAMSFGDNGEIVDTLAKSYAIGLNPAAYQKMLDEGFVYHFSFLVKKPGAYQYRVAIRDTQTGRVGSASQFIEVPDLDKHRLAVSSIILENISASEWRKISDTSNVLPPTNAMSDTALRRVKIGSVLRYGFEIYDARLDAAKQPKLQTKIRVFKDGKLILDGKETPLELRGQTDMQHLKAAGAIAIGDKLLPGDYILQIIVTDLLANPKQQLTSQVVQFEVVG